MFDGILNQGLEDAGVWKLGPEFSSTGPSQSVHLRVGDRLCEVPGYQSSYDSEATPESRVNNVLCKGLPGRISENLHRLAKLETPADGPLLVPGRQVDWEGWRSAALAKKDSSVHLFEVVPMKDLWPSDSASLFLLPW